MSIFLGCLLASILAADEPQPDPPPAAPPDGAIVLFDGRGTNQFLSMDGKEINWPVEDGALVSTRGHGRTNHLVSKLHFRDAEIHVEFMLPDDGPGNSGVYLHGNYELQIFNSFGKDAPTMDDMGAIYGFSKPLANACRKPGQCFADRALERRAGARPSQVRRTAVPLPSVPLRHHAVPG
ncbi:MAG: DUF1080 domain-containing protein [Pirellulaceae bacterium]|nr:DUF1080 domain-containing protein [Pirellulaceae bacterium]